MNHDTITSGKILVVDDSPIVLEAMCEILNEEHDVIFATSGRDALEMALSENPDLILLDVVMPELNGFEVCATLKAHTTTANIPVIFMTSLDNTMYETQGLHLGAIDYFTKPFNPVVVKARVHNHLKVKRQQDALRGLTYRDGLTGISNRRAFDEALQEEWSRAMRTPQPLSLIMIDIDHFKLYNDHYGHPGGDDCLRKVAGALQGTALRPVDTLARFGGEEFACLLPGSTAEGTLQVAERFQQQLAALAIPHAMSKTAPIVTLSIGLATLVPSADSTPEHLLEAADHCLYEAKRTGRNRIAHAGSLPQAAPAVHTSPVVEAGKPTVLLVDDDRHMRMILSERLSFLGAHIEAKPNGQEALAYLEGHRPSLILSDAVMPGMDGFEFCRLVKEKPANRTLPFVLLTSLSRDLRERSSSAGTDDYLSKMEEDAVFRIRLRSLLELGILLSKASALPALPTEGRLMLVSDNSTTPKQLAAQLKQDHVEVLTVPGLGEALDALRERVPEALLLDLDCGSGVPEAWFALMRGLPVCDALPTIALVSKGEGARLAGVEAHVQDRILKPLDAHETRHRIHLMRRLAQARRAL